MSSVGKRIALGIAGGLQGAVEGVSTAQKLQTSAEQAKAQLAFSQANLEQVAAEREKMANQIQDQSMKTFDNVMKDIALLPDDASRKAAATIQFPILNKLAPKAGYQPFTDPDEIVNHFKIGELRQSEIDWSDSVKNIPQAINGKLTPEQAADAFRKAENALTIQSKYYLANPNDIDAIKRKSAQLEQAKTVYYQKSQKLAEANAPAAVVGGKPISMSDVDTLNKIGGLAATGQIDEKTGKPVLAAKPKETSVSDERNMRQARNAAIGQFNKIRQDPTLRKLEEQQIGTTTTQDILQAVRDGNTVASAALGTKMAKAMGEVGVLTEQDVTRYTRSGKLTQQAADTLKKWVKGVPTEATLDEIQQITNVMGDRYQSKVQPIYDKYVNNFAKVYKVDPLEAADLLSVTYSGMQPSAASAQSVEKPAPTVTKHGFDLSGIK